MGFIRTVLYEALDAGYFKSNPLGEVKNLKVPKKLSNIPPTDEEMVLICDLLKSNNYGFRPEELRNLKIKHLDFKEEFIVLDAELGKTDIERDVPMLGNVYNLLIGYKDLNPFGT